MWHGKTNGLRNLDTLDAGEWEMPGADIVIATGNIGHLARFADARHWRDITG